MSTSGSLFIGVEAPLLPVVFSRAWVAATRAVFAGMARSYSVLSEERTMPAKSCEFPEAMIKACRFLAYAPE